MAHIKPAPADARLRYPALAGLDDATWQYWLADAERMVDQSWPEPDYAPALIALAAHNLTRAGAGPASPMGSVPAGLTSFKSGGMSLSFSDTAAAQSAKGGYESTTYGQEWLDMARRRGAGPIATGGGHAVCGGYRSSLMGWG